MPTYLPATVFMFDHSLRYSSSTNGVRKINASLGDNFVKLATSFHDLH